MNSREPTKTLLQAAMYGLREINEKSIDLDSMQAATVIAKHFREYTAQGVADAMLGEHADDEARIFKVFMELMK
jgi:hypothetical protein